MLLPDTFQPATVQSRLQSALSYAPEAGEYLGVHMSQAYDRTTTGRVQEEYGIMRVESRKFRDAGRGYDQWQRGEGTPFSLIMPRPGK